MELEILRETNEWIAVNKPSGLLVEDNPFETSVEYILKKEYSYIGIVHRLDRVTSGVLLLAKKRSALKNLNKQFSDKLVQKTYHAIVENKPPKKADTLTHYLEKDQLNKRAIISEEAKPNNQLVALDYKFIEELNHRFLLEIKPKTGKFHQIRAQLAYIACPVGGDTKYNGSHSKEHLKHIALQASCLQFTDPKTNKMVVIKTEGNFRYKN